MEGFLHPIDKAMVGRVRRVQRLHRRRGARRRSLPRRLCRSVRARAQRPRHGPRRRRRCGRRFGRHLRRGRGLLRRLQPLLRQRSVAPALKTIRVAVQLCRDADLDLGAACLAAGINQDGAVAQRRVEVAARIREMGLLEQLGEQPGGGGGGGGTGTAAVGAAHGPAAGDDVPGGRKSARRAASSSSSSSSSSQANTATACPEEGLLAGGAAGASSSSAAASVSTCAPTAAAAVSAAGGAAAAAGTLSAAAGTSAAVNGYVADAAMYAWPMDDEGWLAQLQERIGKCVGKCHGGHVALPELRVVAAAVELCLTSQYDVDFAALRAKFAIDVSWGHLKEVAEKIKRLGLLEVEPAELSRTAPAYDAALLASLQLRLQEQTPPNLAMISVALDLAHEPHLPSSSAASVGGSRWAASAASTGKRASRASASGSRRSSGRWRRPCARRRWRPSGRRASAPGCRPRASLSPRTPSQSMARPICCRVSTGSVQATASRRLTPLPSPP